MKEIRWEIIWIGLCALSKKVVTGEIKHIFSPRNGKLHTARFFSGLCIFLQDFFSSLCSHITLSLHLFQGALSKQGHTFSNTVKSLSESCYFLLQSFIGKRKTHIYGFRDGSDGGLKYLMGYPNRTCFLSGYFHVVTLLLLKDVCLVSDLLLDTQRINSYADTT